MEFVPIEVVPGTVEYGTPPAPWLVGGPYRLYETPQAGSVNLPTYYCDWLAVPGHPEFNGQFFNFYCEIRDLTNGFTEWAPDNNVAGSVDRAVFMATHGLDSMAMTTVFTHEPYISALPRSNWQAILRGVTNSLAPRHPIYVTLDYASKYARATRTSRLADATYDPLAGSLTFTFSGKSDLDLQAYVFTGADGAITNTMVTIPAFSTGSTNTFAIMAVAPTILTQPQNLTSSAGDAVAFSALASGTPPLSYQWVKNGTNVLGDSGNVMGAMSNVLNLSGVLGADRGAYSVTITNAAGAVTSTPAWLVVIDPVITNEPVGAAVVLGSPATFLVGTTGTLPRYQWCKDGQPLLGATDSSLAMPAVTDTDAGAYTVAVSNAFGVLTSSPPALLTVLDPPAIARQPVANTVRQGQTVTFEVIVSGTPPIWYQWRKDGVSVCDGDVISGATTAVINISKVTDADSGTYSVLVTNLAGSQVSQTATLTVLDPPMITQQPTDESVAATSSATFTVLATGTNLTYQWIKNATNLLSDGANVSGSASNILVLTNVLAADDGRYSVVVSSAGGSLTSIEAVLGVVDPIIQVQPSTLTCVSGDTVTFMVTAAGTPPLGYQWFKTNAALEGATDSALVLPNASASDAVSYSVLITNSVGNTTSDLASLRVIARPTLQIVVDSSGFPSLSMFGSEGALYVLQATTNFTDWADLTTNSAPYTWMDFTPSPPTVKFYRAAYFPSAAQ
jgi:hypothetical protein